MRRSLRRRVRALQAYAGGSTLALVIVASTGLTQSTASQRIDELTVERLNVVDANGTLRVVLSIAGGGESAAERMEFDPDVVRRSEVFLPVSFTSRRARAARAS